MGIKGLPRVSKGAAKEKHECCQSVDAKASTRPEYYMRFLHLTQIKENMKWVMKKKVRCTQNLQENDCGI